MADVAVDPPFPRLPRPPVIAASHDEQANGSGVSSFPAPTHSRHSNSQHHHRLDPSPPCFRHVGRRRATSLDLDEANRHGGGDDDNHHAVKHRLDTEATATTLAPEMASETTETTAATTLSPRAVDGPRERICLCQPAPKVPRPRNAFILYRQHHQAQVSHDHPGLPNPDISKIIGEQWQAEPEESKQDWKRLAEDEKKQHQRQYPDYRYQPRRGGKSAATRQGSITTEETERCAKCGGRYIATPKTPQTPCTSHMSSGRLSMPSSDLPTAGYTANGGPRADADEQEEAKYRPSLKEQREQRDHYVRESPSADTKRRRFSGPGNDGRSSSSAMYQQQQQSPHRGRDRRPMSSYGLPAALPPQGFGAPPPLPGPAQIMRPQSAYVFTQPPPPQQQQPELRGMPMGPPPRPHFPPHTMPQGRHAFPSESLRLPPLLTGQPLPPQPSSQNLSPASFASQQDPAHPTPQLRPPPQQKPLLDPPPPPRTFQPPRYTRESRTQSVEAMVMSIPFLKKLKVLSRVSPPLATPGPDSPAVETRGPLIAVESAEPKLQAEIAARLLNELAKTPDWAVKTWTPDSDVASGKATRPGEVTIDDVILNMREWHDKSAEMVKYITTHPPLSGNNCSKNNYISTNPSFYTGLAPAQQEAPHMASPLSHDGASKDEPMAEAAKNQGKTQHHHHHHHHQQQQQQQQQQRPRLPIALLPAGYSLSMANRYACQVPIKDSYPPIDHWQWMATLWRGIVGADLIVYVQTVSDKDLAAAGGAEVLAPGAQNLPAWVMHVMVRESTAKLSETGARRLAFEVGEWVTAASFKNEFSAARG